MFSTVNAFCVSGSHEQAASEYVGLSLDIFTQEKYQDLEGKMCSL